MMEQEQPEANASNSLSDLLPESVDEEQRPLGFDSELLGGEVDAGPQVSSHEQMNQELLIRFDEDKTDTRGILQPQRVGTGAEGYPEDEHHQVRGNSYLDQKSGTAADSERKPQSVIIDYDDGSRQKQRQYESADTGFSTYTATPAAVVDDDDDDNDEHKNRYVLDPQEFSVHAGSEADVGFDALGNRYFSQSQNNEEESQQEPPELLFEPDEGTDYVVDDEENDGYMRHAEPSPPEADLDIEGEAPELQFEPDVDSPEADLETAKESNEFQFEPDVDAPEADLETAKESNELQFEPDFAGHGSDDDSDLYNRQSQPFAPEDDLETAQDSPELQFEPDDASGNDSDGDQNHRYIPHSHSFAPEDELETGQDSPELQFEPDVAAPEDDLETAQDSPELQFEPEDDENQYIHQSQTSAPEADLDAQFFVQHSDERDDDVSAAAAAAAADDDNDDNDEGNQHVPESQRVAHDAEHDPSEMQFQPEDEKIDDYYFTQSQNNAQDVDQDTAALHFEHEEAVDYRDEYDDEYDDENPYASQSRDANVEEVTPQMQTQPDFAIYAAASHDNDDDDDDDDGSHYTSQLHNAAQTDVEEVAPELHSQPDDAIYAAASHDNDDDDDDDDGSHYTSQLQNAAQAGVEDVTPELNSQPDDDDNDDGSHYASQLHNAAQASVEDVTPELNSQPDDDDNDDGSHYASQLHNAAQASVEDVTPELNSQPDDDDNDDGSHYTSQLHNAAQAGVEDVTPELNSQPDDDDNDDGSHYTSQLHNAAQADVEEVTPELHSQPDDSIYDASSHDNDYYYDDDHDHEEDFDRQTHQIHNVAQGNVEDESPEYNQQQRSYYEEEYDDDDDDDRVIIGRSAVEADHEAIYNEDYPRVLIKGILSESDEQYAENAYEEENEEEEDDTDVAIDIRDNTNVEDQFIEFEDTSFVESAVGGVMDDSGLNDEKHGLRDDRVDDELRAAGEADDVGVKGGGQGAAVAKTNRVRFADEEDEHQGSTGETVVGADDDSDNDGVQRPKVASTSRVRFADERDPGDKYPPPSGDANGDDYHIVPGSSNQPSYDVYDHNNAEKSLDMLLLEEICEEAASMTIKEALVHSLKPNVRAGLSTAHLKLSESEVLVLEEYCEDFVGGLIKDLLKRSSLMELSNKTKQTVVKASVIKATAKHLSTMEVQQLKIYCDHFVHNVIAESIIDSNMIVARQQHQAEEIKELLQMFQNSEEMQEYFTNLTTDIVRTALLNVTEKDNLEEYSQDKKQPIGSSEYEPTDFSEQRSYPDEGLEFENQEDDFDFDSSHSFGFPVHGEGSAEYRRSKSQDSWTSEDEDEMGTNVGGGRQRMTERSPGDNTFEFDEEWAEGVIGKIEPMGDGEKRQKIFMRELEFDDRANVGGTELLAPVFLAVAEDNEDDTEFEGLRRKTQSIEDLCDLIEEEMEPPRKRASSLTQPKKKPRKKPRPNSFREQMEELKREAINENIPNAEPEEEYPTTSSELPSSPKTEEEHPFNAYDDDRYRWHTIRVNNREKVLDLKLLEPYMKVITHGGVHMPSRAVIVVIAACYLPDKTKKNYNFLMEQLFFYLISTLELLATTDEYFLVYFNGGTTQGNQPALPWMKRFYQHIEGGLKKNMINMYIVHPNFWLKTVVRFAKAFVGTNFWSKLQFIKSLDELSTKIPVEFIYVPDEVIRCDPKYKRVHNL